LLRKQSPERYRRRAIDAARAEATIALAGPAAEDRFLGVEFEPPFAEKKGDDRTQADHAVACALAVEGRKGRRHHAALFAELTADAKKIVEENWQSIERLAGQVRRRKVLDYDEIVEVVERR
jgi:hypothetical protein